MKALFIWPPYKPNYFNLCYHYADFGEIAGYIKNNNVDVDIFDGGVYDNLDNAWNELKKQLANNYDLFVILNNFEFLEAFKKVIKLCIDVNSKAKILTYGQASSFIPNFFKEYYLDAIVNTGNWEIGIKNYIDVVTGNSKIKDVTDLLVRQNSVWIKTKKGDLLEASKWGFPLLDKLPLNRYAEISRDNENISGVINKKELSVTVAKGCAFNCLFCTIPKIYGPKERRRDVESLLNFIEKSLSNYKFDFVSLFCPAFTLDRNYVIKFCNEIKKRGMEFKWKCVTHVNCVDEELLKIMSESGCFRIGFGIETLEKNAQKAIKKPIDERQAKKAIEMCLKYGIEPVCFIMIGIPEQTETGLNDTVEKIKLWGGKIRTSVYTPFYEVREDMSEQELIQFDKKQKFLEVNWKL